MYVSLKIKPKVNGQPRLSWVLPLTNPHHKAMAIIMSISKSRSVCQAENQFQRETTDGDKLHVISEQPSSCFLPRLFLPFRFHDDDSVSSSGVYMFMQIGHLTVCEIYPGRLNLHTMEVDLELPSYILNSKPRSRKTCFRGG